MMRLDYPFHPSGVSILCGGTGACSVQCRVMASRRVTILSGLSLLLLAAAIALWGRSYLVEDHVTPLPDSLIVSRTGELTICYFRTVQTEVTIQRHTTVRHELYATIWRDLWSTADSRWHFAVSLTRGRTSPAGTGTSCSRFLTG